MRKSCIRVVAVVLACATAMALAGCASSGQSASDAAKSASGLSSSVSDVAKSTAETGEYSGTLAMAFEDSLTVAGDDGDKEFATDSKTVYDLGDVDGMYLDDIVSVTYRTEDGGMVADKISIVEHMDPALPFAGTLVDWDDDSLTLADNSLTVTFQKDEDSYIVGDFSQGDAIELTYLGDLSEYPYANVIAVVTEAEQPDTLTVHGVVSELIDGTLLLGIDSAHAYRFALTNATATTGAANSVAIGDQVDVTYRGSLGSTPEALTVNIVKQGQARAYIINGTVSATAQGSVTLKTDRSEYTFATTSSTRFYGETPTKDYRAEITYTGALNSKPQAQIVYCVKDAKTASGTSSKAQGSSSGSTSAKSSSSSSAPAASSATSTGQNTANASDAKSSKKSESKSSTSGTSGGSGKASDQGAQESVSPASETDGSGTDEQEQPSDFEPVDDGAAPSDDESAAGDDEQQSESEATEPEPEATEPEAEPESEAAEPADAAATEEEPEPEAAEPEPEPEAAEPEPEPEEVPDMNISGQGTIVGGDESSHTIVVDIKGTTLTLTYDGSTKIASGYIPQEGDVVKAVYGNTSMTLKKLQLVSRAKDADEAKADEPAASQDEGSKGDSKED